MQYCQRLLALGLFLTLVPKAHALPFAEGKGRFGYASLPAKQGQESLVTAVLGGSGRFGYRLDDSPLNVALDITAFRVLSAKDMTADTDGNTLRLSFGYDWEYLSTWISTGAGELRTYDREEEKSRPYRYYVTDSELGLSFDFYRSEEARVTFGASLGRLTPDPEWRARYQRTRVDSLQFEIGFKLLNW